MTQLLPRERLIVTISRLLEGVRHVAVGASSPIPAAGAMLLRALAEQRRQPRVRISILGSTEHNFFTNGSAELFDWAKKLQAPLPLVQEIAETGELPVPLFCAGGIATPADAALVMQLGAEAVFVGSGIFKSDDPATRAKAIVEATTNFRDADILAKVSRGLGPAMPGLEIGTLDTKLADRGW